MELLEVKKMELLTLLVLKAPEYLTGLSAIIASANVFTAVTPTKVDDKLMSGLGKGINIALKILNVLSLNIGKNKNADDK